MELNEEEEEGEAPLVTKKHYLLKGWHVISTGPPFSALLIKDL